MVGLPITGRPDKRTLWKMGQPRCGLPDKAPVGSGVPAAALTDPSNNPMNYYVPGNYICYVIEGSNNVFVNSTISLVVPHRNVPCTDSVETGYERVAVFSTKNANYVAVTLLQRRRDTLCSHHARNIAAIHYY